MARFCSRSGSLQKNELNQTEAIKLYFVYIHNMFCVIFRCNECLQESTCPSYFYELDLQIQGQKQLSDCLTEFLREESLTGSNQVRDESHWIQSGERSASPDPIR